MNGIFEIFANSFGSEKSTLSTSPSSAGSWVAGTLVTSALAAAAVYFRYNPEEIFKSKEGRKKTVRMGNSKLECVSTPTHLLLEYRGALPTETSDNMKKVMGKAIKTFLNLNRRNISHDLPISSFFNTVLFAKGRYNKNISYHVNRCANCTPIFKLEIFIPENLDDSQWKSIENRLLDWRKPFSLTRSHF